MKNYTNFTLHKNYRYNYLALDIGNVLCKVDIDPFINTIADTFSIFKGEAEVFVKRFQKSHDLGYTNTEEEIRSKFVRASEHQIKIILDAWNNVITTDKEMLTMLNEIKEKYDLVFALLSNIGTEHASLIQSKLDHEGFLDKTVHHFSCEVGARKPSLLYYQSFLIEHPSARQCMYVDDLTENIEVGRKMGFEAVQFDLTGVSADISISELRQKIEKYCQSRQM